MILLASYPKSGNTWMRALLSNYLAEDAVPASINELSGGGGWLFRRHRFDENLGLSSSIMTADEILLHLPRFHQSMAVDGASSVFAKVHAAFSRLPDGAPLFPSSVFSGAVCIVRNPLDIAVSYAHHLQCDLDQAIKTMADRQAWLDPRRDGMSPPLPQRVSDWSANVTSWLDQDELPVKLVRYEAMHTDPGTVLEAVAGFAGLQTDSARIARAVNYSRFRNLCEQEERDGFHEKQPTAPSFFRKGQVGDWCAALSRQQARRLVERHGPTMARLGYLDEAERFLSGR